MNIDKLIKVIPDSVIKELPSAIGLFKIDTSLRLSHFLSQCSHESGGFQFNSENLNYGSDALSKAFGKYFTIEEAKLYARNPEKIANRIYANRMGNGNEASGDGYKFRGRGFIQLTGKENYLFFSKHLTEDCTLNPELVASKYPLLSAGWFWDKNKINSIADLGSDSSVVEKVTRRVNGGTIGLIHRQAEFNKFYNILK